MTRSAAFLVVAVLLCIVLPETACDVLRCRGERQSDGQFYFNMTYDLKKGVQDCETQWVINGTVVGIAYAYGNTEYIFPLLDATANTAILKTCHETLECLLICPSNNINTKEPCPCDMTSATLSEVDTTSASLPEVDTTSTTFPEVGLTDWSVGVWIGVCVSGILLVSCIIITLYKKIKRSGRALSCPCAAEEVV